uniref:RNA recognition motif. (A.k.a. RRM, RBD, or RNP domain) n=1 Tax=Candidatus Kentrum sp. SD TaxID=2126332 RepID=A0A450YRM9_9GAMM|nr:MAG: RNA recognition motif. (a.k.a. RRM, RBD, or RNP domain) [Candidatus Kentron sp. SD]
MEIFVAGLPSELTDIGFRELFLGYGSVVYAKIIKDKETGKSRGFGFVKITNPIEANLALEALNRTRFLGRKLFAKKSEPKKEPYKYASIYI